MVLAHKIDKSDYKLLSVSTSSNVLLQVNRRIIEDTNELLVVSALFRVSVLVLVISLVVFSGFMLGEFDTAARIAEARRKKREQWAR